MSDFSVVKELIREQLDIVVLLEYYNVDIPDKNYRYNKVRTCCPIHEGDNPTAFSFDLNKKEFTCFTNHCCETPDAWFWRPKDGSQIPRDVFLFIKAMEEKKAREEGKKNFICSFPQAVKVGSMLTGIPLDDETTSYNKEMMDKLENNKWMRSMARITQEVELVEFSEDEIEAFRALLPLCEDYVVTRGFDQDILDFFELGYSPDGVDEPYKAKKEDFPGRLIFPIRDADGRLVGWSGRLATSDKALEKRFNKYMHKLDFDKGFVLYNFHNAKEYIKQSKDIILVEGTWDVMRLWSYGIFNAVAVMGSSLTPEQLSLVVSSAFKVHVFLDADGAGQSGARRICEQLRRYVDVYMISTVHGKDPDELSFGEAWECISNPRKYIPEPIVKK